MNMDAIILLAIGAVGGGIFTALGLIIGEFFFNHEEYVPTFKRTQPEVERDEPKTKENFSVINIEDEAEEIFDELSKPEEPIEDQADVYEATVEPEPPVKMNHYLCDADGCKFRAKNKPADDGKHYCKNHVPEKVSD